MLNVLGRLRRMKRYVILLASVVMQLVLGGVYAWSAFVPALQAQYGLTGWQGGSIFGTTIIVFTVTLFWAGPHLPRIGPRRMAAAGGLCYGLGYLVAGYSGGTWWGIGLGIGLLSGIGIGLGYVCPLTTCVRWFPRYKGLVTGIAVAGFGGGALLLAEIVARQLEMGHSPLAIFRGLGVVLGLLIILCAMALSWPATDADADHHAAAANAAQGWRRDVRFWRMVAGMFGGTFGGLLIVGHLAPIAVGTGLNVEQAAWAVGSFSVGNALGRIVWGWMHDHYGHWVVTISMFFLAVALFSLGWAPTASVFILLALAAGFGFGACFVVFAAEVAACYGHQAVAILYPKIFLAYGVAGVAGPPVGGVLYDLTGGYWGPIVLAAGLALAGALSQLIRD